MWDPRSVETIPAILQRCCSTEADVHESLGSSLEMCSIDVVVLKVVVAVSRSPAGVTSHHGQPP